MNDLHHLLKTKIKVK